MLLPRRRLGTCFAIAGLATAAAGLLRYSLDPVLGAGAPFTLFLLAVVVAAWFGGLCPGLLATLAGGAVAELFFTTPTLSFSLTPDHLIRLVSYTLVGTAISFVSELWHRSSERERARAKELEVLVCSLRKSEESLERARRSAEERLEESTAQFRAIADLAPVKLWITDEAGRCTYLSPRWYAFSGRTPEQDLGYGWRETVHPEDVRLLERVFDDAMKTTSDYALDCRFRRHDGEYRWMASAGSPRFDEAGAFLGYVGAVVDIHERKVFEQEMKEAGRRKDVFLATLAHELRNPLAPIRNGLHVMRLAGEDSATVDRARDMIDRQLGQMVRLIDDLLDVSRITSGKIELRKSWVNLQDAVQNAVETNRPLIDTLGQDLEVTLPPEPILLDGDATRLAQAFSNLLQNAAKYSDRGGRISVTARNGDGRVEVSVRDAGIGIPADLLPHVFSLFMQGDRTHGRSRGGLGIGLTLVKRLVELHDGTVEARSGGAGLGSEFVVTLPTVELPKESGPAGVPPAMARPVPATRRRVLVVDDNEDSVESLAALVALMGHESVAARDGTEAIKLAASFRPDTVLLDLGMPRMSGFEVCRAIREEPWGASMTIVAVTGWGQSEDRIRTSAAGFDDHFVKPLEPAALAEFLARPLPRSAVAEALEAPTDGEGVRRSALAPQRPA